MDEGQENERKREVCFFADRRVMHEPKAVDNTTNKCGCHH